MDTACNFALMSAFNALHDITWSFQYSLCGPPRSTGGFTTFLYDANTPVLTGGGVRSGLCYGPYVSVSEHLFQSGLSGAIIGIGFDSTGLFAAQHNGFLTGTTDVVPNSITIRSTQDYVYQGSIQLAFDVLEHEELYRTLRFNLTDLGQTLNIHLKNNVTGKYDLLTSFDTGMLFTEDKMCKIGMSFASPVSASDKACLKIKDFHYHGTP